MKSCHSDPKPAPGRSTVLFLSAALAAVFAVTAAGQPNPNSIYLPYTITTFAGQLSAGNADGQGTAAQFNHPSGVAIDSQGNVYVADTDNDTIRKISPSGAVVTLAGQAGQPGSADGPGSSAQFNHPFSVAVDELFNVFVADTGNDTIRKITQSGGTATVSTLAGLANAQGSADGTGSAARFFAPHGVAVDAQDLVYVADTNNSTIRTVTQGGVVKTLAGKPGVFSNGDGTGAAASFNSPNGIAVDFAGDVVVADSNNNVIRNIVVSTAAVTTIKLPFTFPSGVTASGTGDLYVADTHSHTLASAYLSVVQPVVLGGLAGTSGNADGIGKAARFNGLTGVVFAPPNKFYIADRENNEIRLATAIPVPVITSQPQSATVMVGGNFTLSVTATCAAPLSYQWHQFAPYIAGATNSSYTKTNAQTTDSGTYTVDVYMTDSVPGLRGASVTSAPATVTVTTTPPPPSSGGRKSAPSYWFYAALALIVTIRIALIQRRRVRS